MSETITLSETMLYTALTSVLKSVNLLTDDPGGIVPIVKGQDNRVPQPAEPDYIVMWSLGRDPLATIIGDDYDTKMIGSITNNILTVTQITDGPAFAPMPIFGAGIVTGCRVLSQRNGITGDIGQYDVSPTPDNASTTVYIGTHQALEMMDATIQIDVYGPRSADNVTQLVAILRDYTAVTMFSDLGLDIAPLYIVPPRQTAFNNAEEQWEERWTIDLHLQINPVVATSVQFPDVVEVEQIIALPADIPPT